MNLKGKIGGVEVELNKPEPVPGEKEPFMHFVCPDCGKHVKADEDGCCVHCGADCTGEVCHCRDGYRRTCYRHTPKESK